MRKTLLPAFVAVAVLACGTVPLSAETPRSREASAVYPIEEGYVDAHGVMIYYTTVGRGQPLMIVHGGPGDSHDYFLPYLLPLARTNKLIFIDERGSGRSEKLEDVKQYTVENMAADVEAVRVALGLGKISLLGHSYGGVLAQAYALKYPEHLSHLVLASTFASTKEMNQVLLRIKNQMPREKLALATALERAGLYGKGPAWSMAAIRRNTPPWPGETDTFRGSTVRGQIRTTIRRRRTLRSRGTCIARCGDRTGSSSSMAI